MMNNEEKIKPFVVVKYKGGVSLCMYEVGEYKQNIFEMRKDEGFEGNGYDWTSLAIVFLAEKMLKFVDKIDFDPEAGMFCATAKKKRTIEKFAIDFKAFCEDDDLMSDLFSRAELD